MHEKVCFVLTSTAFILLLRYKCVVRDTLKPTKKASLHHCSLALIFRAKDDFCPVTLLTIMDTLPATIIMCDPPSVVNKVCQFFFHPLAHSRHCPILPLLL